MLTRDNTEGFSESELNYLNAQVDEVMAAGPHRNPRSQLEWEWYAEARRDVEADEIQLYDHDGTRFAA